MKKLLLLSALVLSACTAEAQPLSSTYKGPTLIVDNSQAEKVNETFYQCVYNVALDCPKCHGQPESTVDELMDQVDSCYRDFAVYNGLNEHSRYITDDRIINKAHEEFFFCVSALRSYVLTDLTSEGSPQKYKSMIYDCLNKFPR